MVYSSDNKIAVCPKSITKTVVTCAIYCMQLLHAIAHVTTV